MKYTYIMNIKYMESDSMAQKNSSEMTVELAKQLLNNRDAHLTEEGKRILQRLLMSKT